MRPVPAISIVAAAILCGALFGACFSPAAAGDAAPHERAGAPTALPAPALPATGRRPLADGQRRLALSDPAPGNCLKSQSPQGSDQALPYRASQVSAEPRGAARASETEDLHHGLLGLGEETYVRYEEEAPSPLPPTSPALLWLALAVPAGVAYRLVIAMLEGHQAHIVLLACTSLFLCGLVLIGA